MKKPNGFTLVEIIIATALLIIVLSFVFFFIHYWLGAFMQNEGKSQAQDEVFQLVNTMVTELREIEPGETGQFPLEVANDKTLIFYSDIDNDRRIERVGYYLSGETLSRGVVEPEGNPGTYNLTTEKVEEVATMITNGAEPVFYYYNSNWPTDTTNNPLQTNRLLQTSYIVVSLRLRSMGLAQEGAVVASAGASLRTLKSNYQVGMPLTPTPTITPTPTHTPTPTPTITNTPIPTPTKKK